MPANHSVSYANVFESFRSDALVSLRTSITHLKQLNVDLGVVSQFSMVVDTNAIIKELLWLTQKRKAPAARSGLMEVLEAETVKLYGPPALFEEVLEKIPVVAADRNADEGRMFEHWAYFKERIELTVPDPVLTEALRNGVDPDDAEFVALQKTIGAVGIVSEDQHIPMMGGMPVSLACIFYLRDYSRNAAIEMSIKVAGTQFLIVGIAGVSAVCRAARSLALAYGRLPTWIKISLVVGGLLALSNARTRSAATNVIQRIASGIANVSPHASRFVTDAAQLLYDNQSNARTNLDCALTELGMNFES